jgi:hypothetical protein
LKKEVFLNVFVVKGKFAPFSLEKDIL